MLLLEDEGQRVVDSGCRQGAAMAVAGGIMESWNKRTRNTWGCSINAAFEKQEQGTAQMKAERDLASQSHKGRSPKQDLGASNSPSPATRHTPHAPSSTAK